MIIKDGTPQVDLTSGVPLLGNVLFTGVLELALSEEYDIGAYADDFAPSLSRRDVKEKIYIRV